MAVEVKKDDFSPLFEEAKGPAAAQAAVRAARGRQEGTPGRLDRASELTDAP